MGSHTHSTEVRNRNHLQHLFDLWRPTCSECINALCHSSPFSVFWLKHGGRRNEMAKWDWKQRPECCYFWCWSRSGGKELRALHAAYDICCLPCLFVSNSSVALSDGTLPVDAERPAGIFNLFVAQSCFCESSLPGALASSSVFTTQTSPVDLIVLLLTALTVERKPSDEICLQGNGFWIERLDFILLLCTILCWHFVTMETLEL